MTTNLIHAVIIEDHPLYRQSLKNILLSSGTITVTIEANNGNDFIQLQKNKPAPAIILLNINLPEMDGYETMEWIRIKLPDTKVIVMSGFDDLVSVTQMYKMGASSYLQKTDADAKEVLTTVMAVLNSGSYFSKELLKKMKLPDQHEGITLNDLTTKQLRFLRLACTAMTYEEIADLMKLSRNTINDYTKVLYKKFDVDSRVGLILLSIRQKLVAI